MRRHRMSRGKSKRQFRRGASQVHPKNNMSSGAKFGMRGGVRL